MIDLETLGRSNDSAIAQIAAVQFDPFAGETGAEFCVNIDIKTCYHLKIDASTVQWWLSQSKEAINSVFFSENSVGLLDGLKQFNEFLQKIKDEYSELIIWGDSPAFDCEILKYALSKSPYPILWDYWNERDFRTISKLFPDVAKYHVREGIAHDALSDCKNQIAILKKCYSFIYQIID